MLTILVLMSIFVKISGFQVEIGQFFSQIHSGPPLRLDQFHEPSTELNYSRKQLIYGCRFPSIISLTCSYLI